MIWRYEDTGCNGKSKRRGMRANVVMLFYYFTTLKVSSREVRNVDIKSIQPHLSTSSYNASVSAIDKVPIPSITQFLATCSNQDLGVLTLYLIAKP